MSRLVRLAIVATLLLIGTASTLHAQNYSIDGRVVDSAEQPIAYATVVLLRNDAQIAGTITNSEGDYTLSAPNDNYTLNSRSHEGIPDVASWVVPHSVGPRFPGPLLIRTRIPSPATPSANIC